MPSLHVPDMATYEKLHTQALNNPENFWGDIAKQFHWYKPWNTVLEWNCPDAKWFSGGTTNACFNAVDRLVANGQGDDVAILWEGEPAGDNGDTPEIRKITYKELQNEVSRVANTLKRMGVRKGDVVTLYMGMVPELAFAVLACARIGAPHSVIFGGFAASAIVDRVHDAKSKVIVTCDGAWRRGSIVPLKDNVDKACEQLPRPFAAQRCAAWLAATMPISTGLGRRLSMRRNLGSICFLQPVPSTANLNCA